MSIVKSKKKIIWISVAIILGLLIGYLIYTRIYLASHMPQRQTGPTVVKAMEVKEQDIPMSFEFSGNIQAVDEVKIMPKVSGLIVAKYVEGGQHVVKGQPLYRIDPSQYETAYLSAQATLQQSRASYQEAVARLDNAKLDNARYQKLVAQNAVSVQVADNAQAQVNALAAAANAQASIVASNEALLEKAKLNLDDTVVRAPANGKIALDLVDAGTYANAGNTVLASLGSTNKVYAQFNVSENEYLEIKDLIGKVKDNVTITLSNGEEYPLAGNLVQINSQLKGTTGTLTMNALFNNPQDVLIPGMFAKVKVSGDIVPNAVLVPQRAVQQLLEKSFVMVVGADNKSESRAVTLGPQIGSYWIVTSGIKPGDKVIVEGLTKLQPGIPLTVEMQTPEQLGLKL